MAEDTGNRGGPHESPGTTDTGKSNSFAPFFLGAVVTAVLCALVVLATMYSQGDAPTASAENQVATATPLPEPEPVIIYKSDPAPVEARLAAIREEFSNAEIDLNAQDHDSALIKFRTAASLTRELLTSTEMGENEEALRALLANAHRAAGEILFETARYGEAISQYTSALESSPDSPFLLTRRGQCYLAELDVEKATADIEAAVALDDQDPVVLTGQGQLALKRGDAALEALEILTAAVQLDSTVAETHFWLAKALAETGNSNGAMEAYRTAANGFTQTLQKRGGALRWRSCRSSCYIQLGEFSRAVADLNTYLATKNADAAGYANRGYALLRLDRPKDAVDDLYAALTLDPTMISAWINRGDAFMRLGQTEQAIADYEKALELNPSSSVAWHNRGIAHRMQNNLDQALKDLEKALELDPGSPMVLHGIGSIYLREGKFQRAVDLYDKIIANNPADALAHSCRGAANFATGFYQDAVEDFTHAIEHDATKPEVFGRRAVAQNMLGNPEKALEDVNEAIRLSPEDHRLYSLRGTIRHYLNDREGSMADMRTAMELEGSSVTASNNPAPQDKDSRKFPN